MYALGPTVGAALSEAFPGLLRTGWSTVPLLIAGLVATAASAVIVAVALGLFFGAAIVGGAVAIIPAFVAYVVISLLIVPMVMLLVAVPYTAMARSHWRHLRDDVDLTAMDGIRGGLRRWDLVLFVFVAGTLSLFGYLMFLLPGMLLDAALGFVVPAIVVHELSLIDAIKRSLSHFWKEPVWHIGLVAVEQLLAGAMSTLVPVIGSGFASSLGLHLNLRAYVEAFPAPAVLIDQNTDGTSAIVASTPGGLAPMAGEE